MNTAKYRICDKCKKVYLRSNRVRLWVVTNFGHRYGWVKAEQKICCHCLKGADAKEQMREINPKWRVTQPPERIATMPKPDKPSEK